jgi:hypothetical protein
MAIAPCLAGNYVIAGGDTAGNRLNSIISGATALSGVTASSFGALVSSNDMSMIASNFASIRPVSFGAKVTCTQSLTAATGLHGFQLCAAEQFPWAIDTTASVTGGLGSSSFMTAALVNTGGGGGPTISGAQAPAGIGALMSGLENAVNITQPVAGLWSPEDASSTTYTAAQGAAAVGAAGQFNSALWTNATLSENDTYAIPYTPISSATSAPENATVFPVRDAADIPYLLYGASGITTGAFGELEIAICWEGLPNSFNNSVLGPTPSPSNPDEMTQASNVLELIPSAFCPESAADENRKVIEAAKGTTGHLYDGTDRKSALNGSSILKGGGHLLSALSPAISLLPGVGGVLGPGAAMLGGLLANL